MTPATSVPSIPRGFGSARPMIGSPLHQSSSWGVPCVVQQMQQHGGKNGHNKRPKRTVDPEAPRSIRKDTRPKILYGDEENFPPTEHPKPALHDAGLD